MIQLNFYFLFDYLHGNLNENPPHPSSSRNLNSTLNLKRWKTEISDYLYKEKQLIFNQDEYVQINTIIVSFISKNI